MFIVLTLLSIGSLLFTHIFSEEKSVVRNIQLGLIVLSVIPLLSSFIYAFSIFDGTCDNFKGARRPCTFFDS
ncbi:MAG: hypothetical protein AAGD96_36845, partial [Chloroflexota bacterium]